MTQHPVDHRPQVRRHLAFGRDHPVVLSVPDQPVRLLGGLSKVRALGPVRQETFDLDRDFRTG